MSVQFSLRCRVRHTNPSHLVVSVYMKAHEYIESINTLASYSLRKEISDLNALIFLYRGSTTQTSLCSEVSFF